MLKQGTREFLAYFADFQRIMAELKWDPSAKKAALRQGMAWNLKDLLLSYDCPDDWPSYVWLLQPLDSKLRQCEAEKRKETTNMPSRANNNSAFYATTPQRHCQDCTTPNRDACIVHANAWTGRACMKHTNARRQVHAGCIAGCHTTCMLTA